MEKEVGGFADGEESAIGAVFGALAAAAGMPQYEYVLYLVHHNPGSPTTTTSAVMLVAASVA